MVQINPNAENKRKPRRLIRLSGKGRRQLPARYEYRLMYKSADPAEIGCLAVWEVTGGRETYQISLEQQAGGWRRWHCTCPDAIYRRDAAGQSCKHILGLAGSETPE